MIVTADLFCTISENFTERLAEDVQIHDPLDSVSAFPDENYVKDLKNMIRKAELKLFIYQSKHLLHVIWTLCKKTLKEDISVNQSQKRDNFRKFI